MNIHYCAVRLSNSNPWYFAVAKLLYLTFVLRHSNKTAIFLYTYWCHTFDSYTEHVLKTALLDMIDREDTGSLLVITSNSNLFIKHDFVNNFQNYKILYRGTCCCSPNRCTQCSTLLWHRWSSKCSNRSTNKWTNSRAYITAIWRRTTVSRCHVCQHTTLTVMKMKVFPIRMWRQVVWYVRR